MRKYTEKQRQQGRERANKYYYNNLEHVRQYEQDNKERRKTVRAVWETNNPDWRRNYRQSNLEQYLLTSARSHAKRDGIVCSITVEDIVIPEYCPVFGMFLDRTGTIKDNAPSLDKVIPELQYVKGNVRVISWRANRLKHNMQLEEVQAIARYIKEHIEHSDRADVPMGNNHNGNEVFTY